MKNFTNLSAGTNENNKALLFTIKKNISQKKILIIDGDSFYAEKLKSFLEFNNYEVILCSTGNIGIYNIIVIKPDIVISEIYLPDIDGISVLKEINKFKSLIKSNFIYMSKYSLGYINNEVMKLGAAEFITKPVNTGELLRKLSGIFYNDACTKEIKPENKSFKILPHNVYNDQLNYTGILNSSFTKGPGDNKIKNEEINFGTEDKKSTGTQLPEFLLMDRSEFSRYEKFQFKGLTLILVNLNTGNYNEATNFKDFLFPIISEKPEKLLIDLGNLENMDSAYTGVIVEASKRFKLYGNCQIRLVLDPDHSSINPFILDWLLKNFKTYSNLSDAINLFK